MIGLASRVGNARRSNSRWASDETVGLSGSGRRRLRVDRREPARDDRRRKLQTRVPRTAAFGSRGDSFDRFRHTRLFGPMTLPRDGVHHGHPGQSRASRDSNRKRKTAVAAGDAGSRCSTAAISLDGRLLQLPDVGEIGRRRLSVPGHGSGFEVMKQRRQPGDTGRGAPNQPCSASGETAPGGVAARLRQPGPQLGPNGGDGRRFESIRVGHADRHLEPLDVNQVIAGRQVRRTPVRAPAESPPSRSGSTGRAVRRHPRRSRA